MKVTLVVPVKNEADSIERLLASVAAQRRLPDEVILVDGGSADETCAIIERWHRQHGFAVPLRIVRVPAATPGKGRNLGIAAATHEWVALTDAGIRLEPEWLARLCAAVEADPTLEIVYGNFEAVTASFFERCAALAYVPPKALRDGRLLRGPFIASSLLRRSLWERVGGFPDWRAAEDLAFMQQAAETGARTGWVADATVWWQLQPTLRRTLRKFVLYSRHNVLADWQRYWHYGVARQYTIGLACVGLAMLLSAWWLMLPVLGWLARTAKSIWVRRAGRSLGWLLNPAQFISVGLILLALDLAMFVGWGQGWLEQRKRRLFAGPPKQNCEG
ncbi:MAG: glycosyltransferase [Acidobacteria bacterium]|nr:glycosyltransferase [Acidobacteriota bacterium]MBI3421412.1 glycosyltransferase [Acidobacteriota bacterium]